MANTDHEGQMLLSHPHANNTLFCLCNVLGQMWYLIIHSFACLSLSSVFDIEKLRKRLILLTVPRRYFFCGSFMFFSVLCLLCICVRLFICVLWSPAGKGLTSWFSFVVPNCEFFAFSLVSWVRCGT